MATTQSFPAQGDLTNVYFYYTCIAEAKQKYQTTEPHEKEYLTTVVLDKKQYKEFIKIFPKKATQPVDTPEFEEKYKTAAPFPEQDEQFILKFKQKTHKANGEPMPDFLRPRVYQFDAEGVQQDITSTLVGNGSRGVLRWSAFQAEKATNPSVSLKEILVQDLVPYEQPKVQAGFQDYKPQ